MSTRENIRLIARAPLRTGMWSTFLRVNKIASVLEGLNVTSHC